MSLAISGRTLIAAAVALLVVPALARGAGPIVLAPDGSAFWDGEMVENANVRSEADCGTRGPCFAYPLRLTGTAARLRIAIDTPSREDSFQFQAIAPDGSVAASEQNSNQFNEELFVSEPPPGDWTVRVIPKGATRASFRLRAKLESSLPGRSGVRAPLLPNLKTVPPYEFGFIAPANPLNGVYPPDTVNPPADVAGIHPLSCTADEMAPAELGGFEAQRCLRLTSGPINVGEGPYDMRFSFTEDVSEGEGTLQPEAGTIQRGPIFQAVHFSDGSLELRDAGTYSFHVTHAHFHDDNVLTYDLLRVTDPSAGGLVPAGGGTKSGFCPADQLFGEWHRFAQQKSGTFGEGDSAAGGNCFSFSDGFIGLTVGWGDIYRWQRPGQYVEFGSNGDGLYVVQSTVDKQNETLELNEQDNTAYALIRVVGERIDLLERGQGSSPWDPQKVVFRGSGPSDIGARPAEPSPAPSATSGTEADPDTGPASPPASAEAAPPSGEAAPSPAAGPTAVCRVPRLRGLTLPKAKRRLARAHCRLGHVRRPRKRVRGARLVVARQRPGAGWTRRAGARVGVRLAYRR
jgi:hypothetical protein